MSFGVAATARCHSAMHPACSPAKDVFCIYRVGVESLSVIQATQIEKKQN